MTPKYTRLNCILAPRSRLLGLDGFGLVIMMMMMDVFFPCTSTLFRIWKKGIGNFGCIPWGSWQWWWIWWRWHTSLLRTQGSWLNCLQFNSWRWALCWPLGGDSSLFDFRDNISTVMMIMVAMPIWMSVPYQVWEHYDTDANGFIEGDELDDFLREFVSSVYPNQEEVVCNNKILVTQYFVELTNTLFTGINCICCNI